MLKKNIQLLFIIIIMFSVFFAKAQNNSSLYLMNAQNGKVFDISSLNGGNLTNSGGVITLNSAARDNLAVGVTPGSGAGSVFTSSSKNSGTPVYVANASIGTTLPKAVNGLTANPNTGLTYGYVYGLSDDKNLIKASPSPASNLGAVTGDALWNSGNTTVSGDAFFDNAGLMYVVAYNGNAKYLYKINVGARTATQVVQLSGALPSKFEGLAFYNGKIYGVQGYVARVLVFFGSTFNARLYEINPNTGVSSLKDTYQLNGQIGPFQGGDDLDLGSGQIYTPEEGPNCNELFGIVGDSQEIFRINLGASPLTTTKVADGDQTTQGNVAFGPLATDLSKNQFVTSRNVNDGPIYSAPASSLVTTLLPNYTGSNINQWNGPSTNTAPIGLGTDPATGVVWGINGKKLSKWTGSGNAVNLGDITGDALWTAGVTLNDIAVDNGGNLYCIINVGKNTCSLYRVNPSTKVATLVAALTGDFPSSGNVNGNGIAYLGDFFYFSRINGNDTDIWKINALNGATVSVGKVTGKKFGDLATCATVTNVPATFAFSCSSEGAGLLNGPFIEDGVAQTDVLRIPVTSTVNGTAQITIGAGISGISTSPSPFVSFVAQGASFIDVPVSYNGTGSAGSVSVTVASGSATGSCSIPIEIVAAQTDLQVTKTVDVASTTFGGAITFTIKAKNNGPIPSFTTTVTDSWPAGLVFTGFTASKGDVDVNTGTWTMGDLQVGEEATLLLTGVVNATATNSVSIEGNYTDTNTSNNTSSATVTLTVVLDAVADNFNATGAEAITGVSSIGNVLNNDSYDGGIPGSATISNVGILVVTSATPVFTGAPVPAINIATGEVGIPAGTPAGSYTITYQICTSTGTIVCDSANLIVIVDASSICTEEVEGETFEAEGGSSKTFNQPATDYGFTIDILKLDNSFNMIINGVALASDEIQFQASSGITNIKFLDGSEYATGGIGEIWQMTGTESAPIVRVVISPTGEVELFGSKTSGGALFPLVLYAGTTLNTITWNTDALNVVEITQEVTGPTSISGRGYGLNTIECPFCYEDAVIDEEAGSTLGTKVGVSALDRVGVTSTWPGVRESGWFVLEAKTKGFVINRVAFNDDNLPVVGTTRVIESPVEGMIVYDTTNNCLKVYTTTNGNDFAWFCMETQACPE